MGSTQPDSNSSAQDILKYAKEKWSQLTSQLATLPASASGKTVRISSAGCLGRCGEGPVIVVYPEGVWYRYQTIADIDEVLDEHVIKGHIVDRLKI